MNPSIRILVRRVTTIVIVTLACAAVMDWTLASRASSAAPKTFVVTKADRIVANGFELRVQLGAIVLLLRAG
jgi:hypothetical protein